jgi:hypothetical protein
MGKPTHNQIDNILIERLMHSNVLDRYLVVAKVRERLAVNKQISYGGSGDLLADSHIILNRWKN